MKIKSFTGKVGDLTWQSLLSSLLAGSKVQNSQI